VTLNVKDILPNPNQARKDFSNKEALQELADSIKGGGLSQPITVRELSNGKYQIISGERRWRAHKRAKISKIQAIIKGNIKDDLDADIQSFNENLHRADLTPIEEEDKIYDLQTKYNLSERELARMTGKGQKTINHILQAKRFRKKLPSRVRLTTPKTALWETEFIKDENTRIRVLELIHDKKIELDRNSIRKAAEVIQESPPQIQEAVLSEKKKMTIEEAEEAVGLIKEIRAETKTTDDDNNKPIAAETVEAYLKFRNGEKIELEQMKKRDRKVEKSILKGELGGKSPPYSEEVQEENRTYDAITRFADVVKLYENLVYRFGITRGKSTKIKKSPEQRQSEWVDILKRVANDEAFKPLGEIQNLYELNEIIHRETGLLRPIIERELKESRQDLR
jgi:ParB/RepB/Spo0J family partition protein